MFVPSLAMDFGGSGVWDSPMATDHYVKQVLIFKMFQYSTAFNVFHLDGCFVVEEVDWQE